MGTRHLGAGTLLAVILANASCVESAGSKEGPASSGGAVSGQAGSAGFAASNGAPGGGVSPNTGGGAPLAMGGAGGVLGAAGSVAAGAFAVGGEASGGPGSLPPDYEPCPAQGTECKIMPMGDSITMIPGYRVALFRKARGEGKAMTYVGGLTDQSPNTVDGAAFPQGHEAYNGRMIDGIREVATAEVTEYLPHIVLLMVGTNDTHRSADLATAPARLGLLVDAITAAAPDALVVVAKIVPSKDDPNAMYYSAGHNDRIRSFNDAIGPVIEERRASGRHVLIVDMFAAFMATPDYQALMNDNLHPNSQGFAVMTDVWWSAIGGLLR